MNYSIIFILSAIVWILAALWLLLPPPSIGVVTGLPVAESAADLASTV